MAQIHFQWHISRLLTSLFALIAISQPAFSKSPSSEKTIVEHWQETSLSQMELQTIANTERCYSEEKYFIGCFEVLKFLAFNINEEQENIALEMVQISTLASGGLAAQSSLIQPKVKINILSQFIHNYPGNRQSYDFVNQAKDARRQEVAEFLKIHSLANRGLFVDFNKMVSDLLSQIQYENNQKFVIAGAMNVFFSTAVDPHTYVMPTALMDEMRNGSTEAAFVGIGSVTLLIEGEIILDPLENSPAAKAKVKTGDVLTQVDGQPLNGNIDMAIDKLRGIAGTKVQLTLLRDGTKKIITVVREPIEVRNVQSRIINSNGLDFGYIRLNHFMSEQGCKDVSAAVKKHKKNKVKGLILDLRENGGGQVAQAQCMAGLFLGENIHFVTFKDIEGEHIEKLYTEEKKITDLPMVTLIDGKSASAAEMLSGILQYYKRSWVLGDRSFGKGSRQGGGEIMPGVNFMRTLDLFYMPNGWTNQAVGVTPDFMVPFSPGMTDDEKFMMRESELFMNVLDDHKTKVAWTQSRPEEVSKIASCMSSSGKAEQLFKTRKQTPKYYDYQLLSAQDALFCSLQ